MYVYGFFYFRAATDVVLLPYSVRSVPLHRFIILLTPLFVHLCACALSAAGGQPDRVCGHPAAYRAQGSRYAVTGRVPPSRGGLLASLLNSVSFLWASSPSETVGQFVSLYVFCLFCMFFLQAQIYPLSFLDTSLGELIPTQPVVGAPCPKKSDTRAGFADWSVGTVNTVASLHCRLGPAFFLRPFFSYYPSSYLSVVL